MTRRTDTPGEGESVFEQNGVVDLGSGDFVSDLGCLVAGTYYGLAEDEDGWVSSPRLTLPISPLWLVLVLHGVRNAPVVSVTESDAVAFSALCDLKRARRRSNVLLESVGRASRRTSKSIEVTGTADADTHLPAEICARYDEWEFGCTYVDFGIDEVIAPPAPTVPL